MLRSENGIQNEKHLAAAFYPYNGLARPELIVYSRFGSAGRQCAPIAAQMIEKWREIRASH